MKIWLKLLLHESDTRQSEVRLVDYVHYESKLLYVIKRGFSESVISTDIRMFMYRFS